MSKTSVPVAIEWQNDKPKGRVEVINGEFGDGKIVSGQGALTQGRFQFARPGSCRIQLTVTNAKLAPGPNPTRVTVHNGAHSFTLFLRDVNSAHPIRRGARRSAWRGAVMIPRRKPSPLPRSVAKRM